MAVHYVDFSRAHASAGNGSSFANRSNRLDNITFSAGDEVRLMGSPDPTSLGNGKVRRGWGYWLYQGYSLGGITYSTTTGQTNINVYNIGKTFFTGDTIAIYQNSDGKYINGTWEVTRVDDNNIKLNDYTAGSSGSGSGGYYYPLQGRTILLSSACTKNVASTGHRTTAWTASSNVSASLVVPSDFVWANDNKEFNEHYYSDEIDISSSFGTGKAAYWQLPAALDLSGYQQISFMWCGANNSGQYFGTNYSLRLCSDTAGNTTVNTINIDTSLFRYNSWQPCVVDLGSNLGSSIASIALYVDTDQGAQKFWLSNIIACKASSSADSLTHRSLIGLNTANDPNWFGIKSISEKRIILMNQQYYSTPDYGYYSAGGCIGWSNDFDSTTIYKRESIIPSYLSQIKSNSGNYNFMMTDSNASGTNSNKITISGGWNTSDMSSQSLNSTILDCLSRNTNIYWNTNSWMDLSKWGVARCMRVYFQQNTYASYDDIHIICPLTASYTNFQTCSIRKLKLYLSQGQLMINGTTSFHLDDNSTSTPAAANESSKGNFLLSVFGSSMYDHITLSGTLSNFYFGTIKAGGMGYSQSRHININSSINAASTSIYIDNFVSRCQNVSLYHYGNINVTVNDMDCYNVSQYSLYKYLAATCQVNDFTYDEDDNTKIFNAYSNENSITYLQEGVLKILACNIKNKRFAYINALLYTSNDQITGTYSSNPADISAGKAWYRRNANNVNNAHETVYQKGVISNDTSTRHTASGYSWKFYTTGSGGAASGAGDLKTLFAKFAVDSGSQVTIKVWCYPTNSTTKGSLIIGNNTLIGLDNDVTATSSNSGSWAELSCQFTPNAKGFVDVYLTAYNGSSNVWFDDMTITQS